jgi:hypothetical protein|tara:strand:+ start:2266 stop:2754 length:489 start_codon:yes stop_codon:yes gene_type:complete
MNVPIKYLPKKLTKKDKKIQKEQLILSRKKYKKGKYIHRKPVKSYKSKKSKHILNAMKIYKINNLSVNDELSKKTGCTKEALNNIVKKGQGAYYSSGSRPNQTAHSWGIARLGSTITCGKAAVVDYKILENGCKKTSKALKLAKLAKKKYNNGTRRVQKVKI